MKNAKDIPIAAVRFGIEPIKITRNEFSKFIVLRYDLVRIYKKNINIIEKIVIILDLLFVIFKITANEKVLAKCGLDLTVSSIQNE